jgi:hypothetical protein
MLDRNSPNGLSVPHRAISRFLLLLALLLLAGCQASWDEAKARQAKADAVAIQQSLQKPDMLLYRRLTLPPPRLQRLQSEWPRLRRQVALDANEQETFNSLLLRFTEPKAEAHLQRDLNAKIKPIKSEIERKWPLMQSSLNLLLQGWIETNSQLSASEKAHGKALVGAIIAQMPPEWLQDKAMRQKAFDQMVRIARRAEIKDYSEYNSLTYDAYHYKLAEFLDGLKILGAIYGLDWNAGHARLQVKVLAQSGETARVLIRYPLGKKWVEFPMDLIAYQGHWFDASAVRLLDSALAKP